jgi:L-2,4-diaminobutyrate decarboxylase
LLYRDPEQARAAHSQSAAYLDAITARNEWNPSDYAVQLSRRARGLPFWFSLAVHGTDAYAKAIETTLAVTRQAAEEIRSRPYLELLVEPELSVLVFRRHGWSWADYDAWSARLFASGVAFVMPTRVKGKSAARIVILNPRTTVADIETVLDAMR